MKPQFRQINLQWIEMSEWPHRSHRGAGTSSGPRIFPAWSGSMGWSIYCIRTV